MSLSFYNSLTREKTPFQPIDPSHVKLYACGPTVYNYAHIGNARMAVVFDLLSRVLRQYFPKVTYVSNITDVDDKIMLAAREQNRPISEITEYYTKIYNDDMGSLNVNLPDIQPRATDHIQHMIDLITQLIERGHAYEAEGHVLFHVPSDPCYGTLSGRTRDEQVAGARVEVAPFKRDPADFVMWKPSSPDQPGWDSPWGYGRPGWHIECSAMAQEHLGLPFDIHGGGADLKFPHHENEIAQSCCANGHDNDPSSFAKYWMHNGFVTVEGEKMSKSLGNFLLVHDLIDQYPGEVLRLTLLSAHYRQPLDWGEQALHQSQKLLDKLYRKLNDLHDVAVDELVVPDEILNALSDDLNTPKAIAYINQLLKQETDPKQLKSALLGMGDILGILQQAPELWFEKAPDTDQGDIDVAAIESLIQQRQQAKADKDFATADAVRQQIESMGVTIKDTREGVVWERA